MGIKVFGLIVILVSFSIATELGDLAASMQPKTWAKLSTNGLTTSVIGDGSTVISVYADGAVWDPIREQFLYLGSYHGRPLVHICYKASTNTWSTLSTPFNYGSGHVSVGHSYDHNTIDPARGISFYRENNRAKVYQYDIASDKWSSLPDVNPAGSACGCAGMTYFPELGGLVLFDNGWGGIFILIDNASQWVKIPVSSCSYHNFAEYNPVHKVMIFGGGNGCNVFHKMDSTRNITKMKNAPMSLGMTNIVETVDPVSGDYLFLTGGGNFYAYDVLSDTWHRQSGSLPIFDSRLISSDNKVGGIVGAAVSTYGVSMYMRPVYGADPEVWIYKHANSSEVEVPAASARSFSQLEISPNPWQGGNLTIRTGSDCFKVRILNMQGREAACLKAGPVLQWDGKDRRGQQVAPGIYILRADLGGKKIVKPLVLMK
jgi:hypothetical protein